MIFFASHDVLRDGFSKTKFWEFLKVSVMGTYGDLNRLLLKAIVMITNKLPEESNKFLLSPEVLLQILHFAEMEVDEVETPKMSSKSKDAREFCQDHNLKSKLIEKLPKLKILIETRDFIRESTAEEALKEVSEIILQIDIDKYEIAWCYIIQYLEKYLNPKDNIKYRNNIKIFLQTFLQVRQEGEDNYTHNPIAFHMLVRLLHNVIVYMFKKICQCYYFNNKQKLDVDCDDEFYCHHISTSAVLLQYLYILNGSWYQWFDIFESSQVLEKDAFINRALETRIISNVEPEISKLLSLMIVICPTCPTLVSNKYRQAVLKQDVFKHVLSEPFKQSYHHDVSRDKVLENMKTIFYKNLNNIKIKWEFRFRNEVGTGHGPTKEVYSIASSDFQKQYLDIWLNIEEENQSEYVYAPNGLYPKPTGKNIDNNTSKKFSLLGKLMGKALMDGYLLDIPLNANFYQRVFCPEDGLFKKAIYDVVNVLPMTATTIRQLLSVKRKKDRIKNDESLTQKEKNEKVRNLMYADGCTFDDVMINFTIPGYADIEIKKGGKDIMLSPFNVEEYLDCLGSSVMEKGIKQKRKAFLHGFEQVIPASMLSTFLPEELDKIFCGDKYEELSVEYLNSCCEFDGGYTKDSKPVQQLFEVLSSFNANEQRQFLQFVTSMSRLPQGGLINMNPRLTISRIVTDEGDEDKYLPNASTCFNKIYLPEYKSVDVTRDKVMYAIMEGTNYFQFC